MAAAMCLYGSHSTSTWVYKWPKRLLFMMTCSGIILKFRIAWYQPIVYCKAALFEVINQRQYYQKMLHSPLSLRTTAFDHSPNFNQLEKDLMWRSTNFANGTKCGTAYGTEYSTVAGSKRNPQHLSLAFDHLYMIGYLPMKKYISRTASRHLASARL